MHWTVLVICIWGGVAVILAAGWAGYREITKQLARILVAARQRPQQPAVEGRAPRTVDL